MRPLTIVSLWDVIQLQSVNLISALHALAQQSERVTSARDDLASRGGGSISFTVDDFRMFAQGATNIRVASESMELTASRAAAVRVFDWSMQNVRNANGVALSEVQHIATFLQGLSSSFTDEIEARKMLVIPPSKVAYFVNESLFGSQVAAKFPKLLEDIDEGGKCLALGRNTACMFHLMRVLEATVQRLAKKLKADCDSENGGWYKVSQACNKVIDILPAKEKADKAKKQKYGLAIAHLNAVRVAWRNDVAHPKSTYTAEEAEQVFGHTKSFLQSIVPLV